MILRAVPPPKTIETGGVFLRYAWLLKGQATVLWGYDSCANSSSKYPLCRGAYPRYAGADPGKYGKLKSKLEVMGRLFNLGDSDIQEFYTEQLKRVKASSVIHYHANIHKALKYAVKTDLILTNVPAFKTRLLEHQQRIEENKRLCGRSYSKQYLDYICVDSMGNIIKPGYVTSAFPVLLKKHGLRKVRYHDLRHSCASLLLANGVPMKQIQEWLGHGGHENTQLTKLLDLWRLNQFSRGAI